VFATLTSRAHDQSRLDRSSAQLAGVALTTAPALTVNETDT